MSKVYKDKDCDLRSIGNATISVIGYGIQGRAQAKNLRDSGCDVIIGNRDDEYKQVAKDDGFFVFSIEEAVQKARIIMLLIPDESHKMIYEKYIEPNIESGTLIVFAHGYSLRYNKIKLADNVDAGLLAPRFPGEPIRKAYKEGKGVPAFFDVIQDYSRVTKLTLLALGKAIGYSRAGMLEVSYKDETELDLFIEHFIGPLFIGAVESSLKFLVDKGYDALPSIIELYKSGERGSMWTAYAKKGLYKALKANASPTCKFGIASHMDTTFNKQNYESMEKVISNIQDGTFAKQLEVEEENDYKTVNEFFDNKQTSFITKTEDEVDELLDNYL